MNGSDQSPTCQVKLTRTMVFDTIAAKSFAKECDGLPEVKTPK